MHERLPGILWTGNVRDARDLTSLHDAGIAAVVDLAAEEVPARLSRDLTYCRIPLTDSSGNGEALLQLAIGTVSTLVSTRTPTLVACSAGMSRSVAAAAAGASLTSGHSPDDVLREFAGSGSCDVSPLLWTDILRVCSR